MKIVLVGPAWPYRGGIADFTHRLAAEFISQGHSVILETFYLQYPSFLFPGKTQYSDDPAPEGLEIRRSLSSVNPASWIKVGRRLEREGADLLIFSFFIPYFGPCYGTVAKVSGIKSVAVLHNLIPHEKRPGDMFCIRYFCRRMDGFLSLSSSVREDMRGLLGRDCAFSPHPVYDTYGSAPSRDEAARRLCIDNTRKNLLFFGFIRDYKGLDLLIEAYAKLRERERVQLVIAGEFYSGGEKYHRLAKELGVEDEIVWRNEFVPQDEVKNYFGAADLVVQPYRSATQSGITQIAYHFGKPMLVTRVGGLPEIVPDGVCGYVVEPDSDAIARGIERFLEEEPDFSEGLSLEKKKYSWDTLSKEILSL